MQLNDANQGVVIVDVDAGSYASNVGFKRGDIIERVNGQRIEKTRDLARVASEGNRTWRIILRRNGRQITAMFSG